tara:strand:+ start:4666 stop:5967 length:1302 start_codon:yes stop_codon:yes gene_type:complete
MKEITSVTINSGAMDSKSQARSYVIEGDPGAVFSMTVTNEDNHFYNFPENTIILNPEEESRPSPAFSSTPTRLNPVAIPGEPFKLKGSYAGTIVFPSVSDDDDYVLTIYPEMHYDTKLADNLGKGSYIFANIPQLIDTTVTFSLGSTGSSGTYNDLPSNNTVTGKDTRVAGVVSSTFSINWTVSLSSSQFIIAKQPDQADFYFTTTKDTLTAGTGTSLELKDITGLSVGMAVSGTGIASNSTITKITKGYYNVGKSTTAFPVYDIAQIVDSSDPNNPILVDHPGGTVVISNSSTFVADRTLTFKGYGSVASKVFNNTSFSISNFKVELADVTTTTDAAVSNSTTIPIASTDGIKAADTTIMSGVGVIGTPHVDAISSGVNVTASAAQTIENGQTITFKGSSRTATITGDVTVSSYGSDNLTLTLELDNILTVG